MSSQAIALHLYCFPQAGADAAIFKSWERFLGDHVNVTPVTLPGRGIRLDDAPERDFQTLCDNLFDELRNTPLNRFAFLGSSMGGWIAYELAWRFEQIGQAPDFIIALTSPSPDQPRHLPTLENESRIEEDLLSFNPHFKELMQYPELLELLLPTIIADFRMCAGYKPVTGREISTDILAVAGNQDSVTRPETMQPWAQFTSGQFTLQQTDGAHHMHEAPSQELQDIINDYVTRKAHVPL
jgi:medium-chain acyl-[acyl-carrier-protein] hydrolase